MLTNWTDLLNPNVDSADESEAASVLDELTSRRSREAQKNHEVAAAHASAGLDQEPIAAGGAAELEEEAAGEGAFNPETGEINWDCPCLGGMAHGPCGPQFREAFSCFVFSNEEPKGMDCIEKFQGMRDCFQDHPDVYKDELMEDEELDRELEAEKQELVGQIAERRRAEESSSTLNLLEEPAPSPKETETPQAKETSTAAAGKEPLQDKADTTSDRSRSTSHSRNAEAPENPSAREDVVEKKTSQVNRKPNPAPVSSEAVPETESLIPKAAHDARSNQGSSSKDS